MSPSIRPSELFISLASASGFVALLYILSRDPVLLAILSIALPVFVFDLAALRRSIRDPCIVSSREKSHRIFVGGSIALIVEVRCRARVIGAKSVEKGLSLEIIGGGGGSLIYRAIYTPESHGIRRGLAIEITVSSRLGLFRAVLESYIDAEVIAYPEAIYWIRISDLILAGRGLSGDNPLGSVAQFLAGVIRTRAGEYVSSREYSAGDDLKHIDWKATARRLKLYVKEYSSSEGAGDILLLLDYWCTNLRSCDELASSAISITLASHMLGLRVSLAKYENGTMSLIPNLSGAEAFRIVFRDIMDIIRQKFSEVFEYIDPLISHRIRETLSGGSRRAIRLGALSRERWGAVIAITGLLRDPGFLLDICRDGDSITCVAITPTKPWISGDLEESYLAYITHRRIASSLRARGIMVYRWREMAASRYGARIT